MTIFKLKKTTKKTNMSTSVRLAILNNVTSSLSSTNRNLRTHRYLGKERLVLGNDYPVCYYLRMTKAEPFLQLDFNK